MVTNKRFGNGHCFKPKPRLIRIGLMYLNSSIYNYKKCNVIVSRLI
jgi:hypothetical protein